jgi:hypothetical protein
MTLRRAAMSTVEPYRKVLLVLIRHAPTPQVLNAAKSLCERLQAGLEIVCLGSEVRAEYAGVMAAEVSAAGLFCRLERRPQWAADDVVAWANSRACVAAVVLAATERETVAGDEPARDPWQHLACPLVVAGRDNL